MQLSTFTTPFLALVLLAAGGCARVAPVAPVPAAPAAPLAAPPTRQLLAADAAPAVLRSWSLSFQRADFVENYHIETVHLWDGKRYRGTRDYKVWHEPYWSPSYSFDGEEGLTYLGAERFAYRVPKGRFLKITKATGQILVGGTRVKGERETHNYVAGESHELYFGPGQLVSLGFAPDSHLFGYTADVAMLGLGPTPGAAGAASAK